MTITQEVAQGLYDMLCGFSDPEARDEAISAKLAAADSEMTQVIFCFSIAMWPAVCSDDRCCSLAYLPEFLRRHLGELESHFNDRPDLTEAIIPALFDANTLVWAKASSVLMAFVLIKVKEEDVAHFLLSVYVTSIVKRLIS